MKVFSKTPVRIGLIGGGTDLPAFTEDNTGHIVNCTINLYNYVFIEHIESEDFLLQIENINENISVEADRLDDPILLHDYIIFVPTALKYLSKEKGFRIGGKFKIKIESDIARGSGLGGSSSILVGIINAFSQLYQLNLTKHELAETAFILEREVLKIEGGTQDFYTATFGGLNFMHFKKNHTTLVNRIHLTHKELSILESHIVLFYTGIRREAKIIEKEKSGLLKEKSKLQSMNALANLTRKSIDHLELQFDIEKFARCINKSWDLKKLSSNSVSNEVIDNIISLGKECDALSGKISGAGSGGYGFFLIEPSKRNKLVNELNKQNIKTFFIAIEKHGSLAFTL